ncbi:hypothetical protein H3V53_25100 [Paraburkholderia bengalensis]|uniref:Uncharacterized protein n=1 Tax=Paraburkholderia bengalensis TaxID=2747562 RepID=A0ABU8IY35_9BURK
MKLSSPLSAAHDAEPSGVMPKLRVLLGRSWGMFFPTGITRSHEADGEPRETPHATPDETARKSATSDQRAAHSFHLPRFRSGCHHVNSNF